MDVFTASTVFVCSLLVFVATWAYILGVRAIPRPVRFAAHAVGAAGRFILRVAFKLALLIGAVSIFSVIVGLLALIALIIFAAFAPFAAIGWLTTAYRSYR